MLRMPDGMREQLREVAERRGRSMNSEIVSRLEQSLALDLPYLADDIVERITSSPPEWREKASQVLSMNFWNVLDEFFPAPPPAVSKDAFLRHVVELAAKLDPAEREIAKMELAIGNWDELQKEAAKGSANRAVAQVHKSLQHTFGPGEVTKRSGHSEIPASAGKARRKK